MQVILRAVSVIRGRIVLTIYAREGTMSLVRTKTRCCYRIDRKKIENRTFQMEADYGRV